MKLIDLTEATHLTSDKDIELWLIQHNIQKGEFTINKDRTVDVNVTINLSQERLTEIPIKFGKVNGNFFCSGNLLKNLDGVPTEVTGSFYCSNNLLTSLKGAPTKVGKGFYCSQNKFTTLDGAPRIIPEDFMCTHNKNLISLDGAPEKIGRDVDFSNCTNLKTLTNVSKYIKEMTGTFNFTKCPIKNGFSGLVKIKGITKVMLDNKDIEKIINKHLSGDVTDFVDELEDKGMEEFI